MNARTIPAKTLEEKLKALDELFEQMMAELDVNDATQKTLDGHDDSPTQLPPPLADLERRRERVRDALKQAQAADESRRKLGRNPEKNPAQVPTTDPDARVMPNKEGGYAANYTPTATTDGHRGFIVDCDVTDDVNEGNLAARSVDRIEETFGSKPEKFLTDGGNSACVSQQNKRGRTITRDDHEAARERLAERMSMATSQELFRQRSWIAETPFGILKSVMGLRQFLLRGLAKVQTEWTWAVTAFNLGKLVRELARLRAQFAKLAASSEV